MNPGSEQLHFIDTELQRVDRDLTPWVVVVIHTPVYNTFGLHLDDPQIFAAREHLEPLLIQYRVNIVFSGHIHAYSRTHAVTFDKVDPLGPVHITVRNVGQCKAPFRSRVPEEWVAVRDATMYGYGMLRIHNKTIAEWDWIRTSARADGRNYNQLSGFPDEQLPPGPARDHVYITNQYFL